MTLESETLFVVGESDELVCNSPLQSFVISGLKNARVDSWRASMLNGEVGANLDLVTNDVGEILATHLAKDRYQFWIKFEPDKFLSLMKLTSVEVNVDTHDRRVMISLAFNCLPVTFEQAVAIALSQSAPEQSIGTGWQSVDGGKPRKSFAAHKSGRPKPDPTTVVGPADAFSHMRWEESNQVVEFPKVKITKHEE